VTTAFRDLLVDALPLPLALVCFAPVVRDHPNESRRLRAGGHERDAAGAANGSEAPSLMVEREREGATSLRLRINDVAAKIGRMPARLPYPMRRLAVARPAPLPSDEGGGTQDCEGLICIRERSKNGPLLAQQKGKIYETLTASPSARAETAHRYSASSSVVVMRVREVSVALRVVSMGS
jgi:hypothetical protein